MKAILVIDMPIPKNCMSCPLIGYHRENSIVCRHYSTGDTRPSWCPLKPMPEHKHETEAEVFAGGIKGIYRSSYYEGWNDCLDELTGK